MVQLFLFFLVLVLLVIIFFLYKKINSLNVELSNVNFLKKSQSVKYGQLTEQWIPFSEKFPFSPSSFKFLGQPIDGVVFDDEKIVFVEFKTNKSRLNDSQKKIKKLVEDKKVEWLEFRVE
ncbi:MAG: endonuclease [Candidatus Diapherotrites archaeon]|uniref:Endonuclease n=1 Tax=Candidatus Iainarchaeum sp. TaxID=3101447 RepID=A0A7K4BYT0_9ARCH|nr:endonuclease [Candidatus Diapherotrites archaeon]